MEKNNDTQMSVLLDIKETMGSHTAKLENIENFIKSHDEQIKNLNDFKTGIKSKVGVFASAFGFITAIVSHIVVNMFSGHK